MTEDFTATPTVGAVTPMGRAAPPQAAAFAPGELAAGRFRITRLLGAGGAGQVFEALDLEIDQPLALKVLHPRFAGDDRATSLFKREFLLARRITHPNVCRVFDLFTHRPAAPGAWGEALVFLTMELLAGESLGARLHRQGRMAPPEALPLLEQMAAALDAAHAAGVVHRDLKSANVMLVPGPAGSRAVITDFGVAVARPGDPLWARGARGMVGSPAYMAPEQVLGAEVTAAADVYALGVVLCELVTGRRPFGGGDRLAAALQRLTRPPVAPRRLVPDLDRRWDEAILRCLERDPAARFASAGKAVAALSADAPPRAAPVRRPTLAVLGLADLAPRAETAWLAAALTQMLTSEAAAAPGIRALPAEEVRRALPAGLASGPGAGTPGSRDLEWLRRTLGVELVLAGSYLALGGPDGRLRLDLRLQETTVGQVVAMVREEGGLADLFALVGRCGGRLRDLLISPALSEAQRTALAAARPATPEVARLFAEGLEALRRCEGAEARDRLEEAVALDPDYALAHMALSEAWSAIGCDEPARQSAARALELAARLPREQRLQVEGRYWETMSAWDRAAEVYRALATFFPDEPAYALRLAAVQTQAGRAGEALATLEALRALPAPVGDDPRIDLEEARAAEALSDRGRQRAAAGAALAKARAVGLRLLEASAQLLAGEAMQHLGELEGALTAYGEGERIFRAAGDLRGTAQAVRLIGALLHERHDLAAAAVRHEEALVLARRIGNRKTIADALNKIGNLRLLQGRFEEARGTYEEALVIRRDIADLRGIAHLESNLGLIHHYRSELRAAQRRYEKALALYESHGVRQDRARTLLGLGDLLLAAGELPASRAACEQALTLFWLTGETGERKRALWMLAATLLEGGELRAAAHLIDLATALPDLGGPLVASGLSEVRARLHLVRGELAAARHEVAAAEARMATAGDFWARRAFALLRLRIDLEEGGGSVEAEREALALADYFARLRVEDSHATALSIAGACRLALGDVAAAETLAARAARIPQQNLLGRFAAGILGARIVAAAGRPAAARTRLREIVAEARQRGLVPIQLEAELETGRLLLAHGRREAGLALLTRLERRSLAGGFQLVARRAAEALGAARAAPAHGR